MSQRKGSFVFLKIVLLTVGILLSLLVLSAYQVRMNTVALVFWMGKLDTVITSPGLHWKLPWPIQKVVHLPAGLIDYRSEPVSCYTQDEQIINLKPFVIWQIGDPTAFFFRFERVENAQNLMGRILRSILTSQVSTQKLSDFFGSLGTQEHNMQEHKLGITSPLILFEQRIQSRLQEEFNKNRSGISVVLVGFEQVGFPPMVTKDILTKMMAERQLQSEKIRQEGLLTAGQIRAQAQTESGVIQSKAYETARQIRAEADLMVAETYAEFEKDQEFAIFLKQLDTLRKLLKQPTLLIVDADQEPFHLLKPVDPNSDSKQSKQKNESATFPSSNNPTIDQ